MNNIVGLSFNESLVKNRGLWVLWIVHETHWKSKKRPVYIQKKKKERQNVDSGSVSAVPKWVLSVHLSQFGHQPMYPFLQSFRNSSHPQKQCPVSFFTSVFIVPHNKPSHLMLWGPIDPIGTIHLEKGWAYGPIPSPRIRAYLRTIS